MSFDLKTFDLKKIFLRSGDDTPAPDDEVIVPSDFLLPDTFCAVAPDLENNPANESVWFIKVKKTAIESEDVTDDYHNTIPEGVELYRGSFWRK